MITTERLILKPFSEDDLDIIYQLYSDEEIMRYMPVACMDMATAEKHLNKIVGDWQKTPLLNMEMLVSLFPGKTKLLMRF